MRASTYFNNLVFTQYSLGIVVPLSAWTRLPDLAQLPREKSATSSASGFNLSGVPPYLLGTRLLIWLNFDCKNARW